METLKITTFLILFLILGLCGCGGGNSQLTAKNSDHNLTIETERFKKLSAANSEINVDAGVNQISDPNLLVPLIGEAELNGVDGAIQYEWTQLGGPAAYILNPHLAETSVLVPDMQEPAVLHFRLAGSLVKSGLESVTSSDTISLIVNPLQGPLRVVGEAKSESESELVFTVSLDEPALAPLMFDYQTEDRSALDGLDYLSASGTLVFEAGEQEKFITITILDDELDDGDKHFALELVAREADIAPAWGFGVVVDDEAPGRRRFSPLPAMIEDPNPISLQGESGVVQVNVLWENNNNDIDLIVVDPCGNEISYGERVQTCQGFDGQLEADSVDQGVNQAIENIFWRDNAPVGEYRVLLSHFSGGATTYNLNAIWGDESAQLQGEIMRGERIEVFRFFYGNLPNPSPSSSPSLSPTPVSSPDVSPTPVSSPTPIVLPVDNDWINEVQLAVIEEAFSYSPRIELDSRGNAMAVWTVDPLGGGTSSIWYSYFDAETSSWSSPNRITNSDGVSESEIEIIYDSRNTLFNAVWVQETDFGDDIAETGVWWSTYDPGSDSWQLPETISQIFRGQFSSASNIEINIDDLGNLLVVWRHFAGVDVSGSGLWATDYLEIENVWSDPVMINTDNAFGGAGNPQLVDAGGGRAACIWVQDDERGSHVWRAEYAGIGGGWSNAEIIESFVYLYSVARYATTASGHSMLVWDDRDDNVLARHYDPVSGWGEQVEIDSDIYSLFDLAAYGDNNFITTFFTVDFNSDSMPLKGLRYANGSWSSPEVLHTIPDIITTPTGPNLFVNSEGNGFNLWGEFNSSSGGQVGSTEFNPGLGWSASSQAANPQSTVFDIDAKILDDGRGIAVWVTSDGIFAKWYLPRVAQ